MSVAQTALSATEFIKQLDAAVPGTTSKEADPTLFKFMLQSKYGIDSQVLGNEKGGAGQNMITGMEMLDGGAGENNSTEAALEMLGYNMSDDGSLPGGLDMVNSNALATLSKLADEQFSGKGVFSATTDASDAGGGEASDAESIIQADMALEGANVVRMAVTKNEVRMAVNKNSLHPDDLGRLAVIARQGGTTGFTADEEALIMAAASAETLLAEAQTDPAAAASNPVPASSLERAAGMLSARYESNGEAGAVGYDRRGGTSYGKYQIASKTGTMKRFIEFLDEKAPDIAERLKNAGPADTHGRSGKMPSEWKKIASEDSGGFEALQHEFIRENNYTPALKSIVLTSGVDVSEQSYALREVLWSTAVQHGPGGAEKIFSKAIDTAEAKGAEADFEKNVIEEVYRLRSRQFGRHSSSIRRAVQARFQDEKTNAIALLQQTTA